MYQADVIESARKNTQPMATSMNMPAVEIVTDAGEFDSSNERGAAIEDDPIRSARYRYRAMRTPQYRPNTTNVQFAPCHSPIRPIAMMCALYLLPQPPLRM